MLGIPNYPIPAQQLQQLQYHHMLTYHVLRKRKKHDYKSQLWSEYQVQKEWINNNIHNMLSFLWSQRLTDTFNYLSPMITIISYLQVLVFCGPLVIKIIFIYFSPSNNVRLTCIQFKYPCWLSWWRDWYFPQYPKIVP